jgi:hypothetical protein
MATTLHLVIPGLLETGRFEPADPAFPAPAAPALGWLLARADVRAVPATSDGVLFHLFGLPVSDASDLPVAAVTRLADGGEAEDGWWLRADPVHLRPDLRGVYLVDARILAIEPAEARALVEAFNQTFAADELWLDAPRPDRWYLRLPADPGLRSHPLIDAIGRDINPLLPYGPNVRRWHALLTEAQMLFHGHAVNREREQRGQPMINGLWLWGGGRCPTGARAPAAGLYASDPLARGLARLAHVAVAPVPEHAGDWLDASAGESDSLVVLEATRHDAADGDSASWAEHVAELEYAWFTFCRRWLQTGKLVTLRLYPGNGRVYTLTGAARWRFWRRARPLPAYRSRTARPQPA